MEQKNEKRIIYLEVLNIIAIIAVVLLHSTGNFHSFSYTKAWITSCFVQCVLYWAVPVFIMCSGATLFNIGAKYTVREYFRRRVTKVLIPFLFWSAFFICYGLHNGTLSLSDQPIASILNIFFSTQAAPTFYFLFLILGIYLTIPFLTPLARPEFRNNLWYAVVVIFVTKSVLPIIFQAGGVTYNSSLSILVDGYLIFILLGYLLSTQEVAKRYRLMVYVGAVFGVLIRFLYTWKASFAIGTVDYLFSGYYQFHAVLSAAAVFLAVKTLVSSHRISEKTQKVLQTMSGGSFGVFLLHRDLLAKLQRVWDPSGLSWTYRLFGGLLTYVGTLLLVLVMKKIPFIKRLVP